MRHVSANRFWHPMSVRPSTRLKNHKLKLHMLLKHSIWRKLIFGQLCTVIEKLQAFNEIMLQLQECTRLRVNGLLAITWLSRREHGRLAVVNGYMSIYLSALNEVRYSPYSNHHRLYAISSSEKPHISRLKEIGRAHV